MMEIPTIVASIPLLVAAASFTFKPTVSGRLITVLMWIQFGLIVRFVFPLCTGEVHRIEISTHFAVTQLGAAFMLLTAWVAACSRTHADVFFARALEGEKPPGILDFRAHYICTSLFVLAMLIVYLCQNLGFLWIGVESTTLLSAPLVFFNRSKHALEATWKYLMICSVGIAFALLGTLFIFASSQHGAVAGGSLSISELVAVGPKLQPQLLRIGFIFCLLGYGTKSGMFPLHSWLPDAHSEAPAPSSALLSGALLNCALYAIYQVSQIVISSQNENWCNHTIVWAGTITVVAASLFLIRQYSLKRLFAYSSIENVGVMLVAIGLNSGSLFFFQALNHSLAKVSLFLLSGNIVQATGKKNISQQFGLMASAPVWGVLIALSAFAAIGAPPFGTFFSEWMILMKAIELKYYLNAALVLGGLSLAFIVILMHVGRVFLGHKNDGMHYFNPLFTSAIPALLVVCSLIIGLISVPFLK